MATIKISDLQMNEELDKQALSEISGGSRSGLNTGISADMIKDGSTIMREEKTGFKFLSAKHIKRSIQK